MIAADRMRTIVDVRAIAPATLRLTWSGGVEAELDLRQVVRDPAYASLKDSQEFSAARPGEWGHSVEWPGGAALSAQSLWLETLSATGHGDARAFLEWRLRHGLSLSAAAEALGVSRRMVAYYSNGEKPLPKPILLACRGWEALHAA